MKKTNKMYMDEFESKYSNLKKIDDEWYWDELGVKAFCKSSNCKRKDGTYTEEWYRARFTFMLVKSGLYDKEYLCIELSLPKGNGGKAIKPDIVAFKDKRWNEWVEKKEYDEIRKNIIVVFEAKDECDDVEKAIQRQIEVALERRLASPEFEDWAYGIYFDNKDDIVIVKKEGLSALERYDVSKMITSSKNIVRLNVANRDNLEILPGLTMLLKQTDKIYVKHEFTFDDLEPIGQESFQGILDFIQREREKLQYPNAKPILVEILMLKVYEENLIKETGGISRLYIAKNEIRPNGNAEQKFRKRIYELYEEAKETYNALNQVARYTIYNENGDLRAINSLDEKMIISIVKAFQGKSILKGVTTNFNQTIFNNFGDEVEKSVAGQFFTPIPIINAIVSMINPKVNESFIDPCSGICDFQAVGWKQSNSKGTALNYYGVDISSVVLKLAELNLVLNGVGTINLYQKNSIFEKLCRNNNFTDISTFTPDNYEIDTWNHKDDTSFSILQYVILCTNPPFGKGRDLRTGKDGIWDYGLTKDNMSMYETWTLLGEPKTIDMGIIFLENAYKMTKTGGRFAIVLSNSIASIDSWSKVRMWLMEKVRLVGIMDLPQNSFGETGVATTVLIAYKPKENEKYLLEKDYEVFIKEINYTGYEVQTVKRNVVFEPIKEYNPETFEDTGRLREDFTSMLEEFNEFMKSQESEIKNAFGRG